MNNGQKQAWDYEYDVVIVGSGAGGMTAAVFCHQLGLSALVVDKSEFYGGTSAVSGGGVWVPCNDQIPGVGGQDSREDALTYLRHLTRDEVPQAKLETYVDSAQQMIRELAERHDVHFLSVAEYPDYFPDAPGGRPGYRTMEPTVFNLSKLGPDLGRQRPPYAGTLLLGRVAMTQVQAHTLMARGRGWLGLTFKLLSRYWFDLIWRLKTSRDRRSALGQALVGQLRHALQKTDVPLWLNTAFEELVEENGQVIGVRLKQGDQVIQVHARKGVVLASGGFEANQEMRETYLRTPALEPTPTDAQWSVAPGINHGDAIRAGQKLGADVEFMHLTWGTPSIVTPGTDNAAGLFVERQLPGLVAVNGRGERFVNEAIAYTEFVYAMQNDHAVTGQTVPCWIIFDADYRHKYMMGPMMPGMMQSDRKLPEEWENSVYWRADNLEALADKIGVDEKGLTQTIEAMNRYAETGKDEQFDKGASVFDRYYGDPHVTPNPCLAAIDKAPFYAVRVTPGEIGTKGGLKTDSAARVLHRDGHVIPGLYAIGNCSGAVMGRTYPGPGATLGPAMTFGYLAARDLAQNPRPLSADADHVA